MGPGSTQYPRDDPAAIAPADNAAEIAFLIRRRDQQPWCTGATPNTPEEPLAHGI
jgi:hypothetical protein